MIEDRLAVSMPTENETQPLAKELAESCRVAIRELHKDARYKYLDQTVDGQNKGQGVRMGTRQFWDQETDNFTSVTVVKKDIFITVVCFAVYLY